MNSIRQPRRRPRVTSVNFRTLWWLVRCEAAYHVDHAWFSTLRFPPRSRREWLWCYTPHRWMWALRLVEKHPELRRLT